jgi:phosphoglycerate kinase
MEQELEYLGAQLNPEILHCDGRVDQRQNRSRRESVGEMRPAHHWGGMATFLAATGCAMQDKCQAAPYTARAIMARRDRLLAWGRGIADKFEAEADSRIVAVDQVPAGWRIMDIGPKSIEACKAVLQGARLVVWNGPMGVFEMPKFAEGTFAIARLLAASGATTVIGGGDSASAVKKAGC